MTPKPNGIIEPAENRRVMTVDGDTRDIIRLIMVADRMSKQFIDLRKVNELRGADDYRTLENIYWFVKQNTTYKTDPNGQQNVRLPGYLFETGAGDCKSYSVAIAAICQAMGIPYRYRFIQQRGAPNYHHVYIVATKPDGSSRAPVVLDAVHRSFDQEPSYMKKLDLKPGQRIPAGIAGLAEDSGAWIILLLIIIGFATQD